MRCAGAHVRLDSWLQLQLQVRFDGAVQVKCHARLACGSRATATCHLVSCRFVLCSALLCSSRVCRNDPKFAHSCNVQVYMHTSVCIRSAAFVRVRSELLLYVECAMCACDARASNKALTVEMCTLYSTICVVCKQTHVPRSRKQSKVKHQLMFSNMSTVQYSRAHSTVQ